MVESTETIHLACGDSIAGTLRKVLPMLGRSDRVIGLPDTLSVGPIDPPDPVVRRRWCASVLRDGFVTNDKHAATPDDPEWTWAAPAGSDRSWAAATAPGLAPVFWACLSSPVEHACFQAFAARMADRPFDLVDATDLDITSTDGVRRRSSSLGMVRPEEIVTSKLYDRRRPLAPEERRAAAAAWSKLRRENAPFRIVQDGRLVSAPLTHYDDLLLGLAQPNWEIAARLIGRVMTVFFDTPRGDGTGDAILFGRMLALVKAGALELAGPGPEMRDYQVRRVDQ